SSCGNRPSPIGAHPVTCGQTKGKQSTYEGPLRGEPLLEHPADGPAHHTNAEPHAPPCMSGDAQRRAQYQSLGDRVNGSVGWLLNDISGFKVLPHRMSWIRQAA